MNFLYLWKGLESGKLYSDKEKQSALFYLHYTFDFLLQFICFFFIANLFQGGAKKQGCLKLYNALNPKYFDLGSWNFTNLFIGSDKQVGKVSSS